MLGKGKPFWVGLADAEETKEVGVGVEIACSVFAEVDGVEVGVCSGVTAAVVGVESGALALVGLETLGSAPGSVQTVSERVEKVVRNTVAKYSVAEIVDVDHAGG